MRSSNYSQAGERGLFRRDRRIFDQRGTFTFTIPDGVTKIWAFAMGGGGGGRTLGEADSGWNSQGMVGGGRGAGYASGIISGLTPGGTLTCTVASGGIGQWETTAATGGGNTTVAGGGTTYLTANGGGAADAPVTSDPGNKKGQGGTASTSGVTDAYTAAGGGSFSWPAGVGYGQMSSGSGLDLVCGGGASGNPFGTGRACTKAVGNRSGALGGGGWCQREYPRDQWLRGSGGESGRNQTYMGGDGSHHPVPFFAGRSEKYIWSGYDGGKGRTAQGGESYNMVSMNSTQTSGGSGSVDQFKTLGGVLTSDPKQWIARLDGHDGNPNWWFPWEVDGGGGGGYNVDRYTGQCWRAGQGGPGAGGGGARGSFSDTGNVVGGRGGFGGGGGGAWSSLSDIQRLGTAWGGDGGNGGGGGSAWGRIQSSKYMPIGGNGGDGAIGLYW